MKTLTFGKKALILVLLFVVIGIVPVVVLSNLSMSTAEQALEKKSFEQLVSIREIKKKQLQQFFKEREGDMQVLTEMVKSFQGNYQENYDFLDSYKATYGYYDLFLIDPEGNVFYSVEKEADYQTNILTGKYRNSNLGKLVSKVSSSRNFGIIDFERYEPSQGEPAAFIAQPVLKRGKVELIIALQLPLDPINQIMQVRNGMGKTGETYLVGSDQLMRSDSFLDSTYRSVKASFANPQTGRVNTKASQAALAGNTNAEVIDDYNGNTVLSAYTPIKIGDFTWALIAEIDMEEVDIPVIELKDEIIKIGILILLCVLLVVVAIAWGTRMELQFLDKVVRELASASDQVAAASEEISSGAQQLSEGTTEQAAGLEETSSTMEEVSSQANENANNAGLASKEVQEMAVIINTSIRYADQANSNALMAKQAAEKGVQAMQQISASMISIEEGSNQISDIIDVINDITHQTKMLATNAAIEAARAGEQGKGFAVVADEVSKLAENSKSSAKEIAGLIRDSVHKAKTGTSYVEEGDRVLKEIFQAVSEVTESITGISQSSQEQGSKITQIEGIVADIKAASQEQAHGITQVSTAVRQMDDVTQSSAANAEESASSSEELSAQAIALSELVTSISNHFGVKISMTTNPGKRNPSVHARRFSPQLTPTAALSKELTGTNKKVLPTQAIPMRDDFRDF